MLRSYIVNPERFALLTVMDPERKAQNQRKAISSPTRHKCGYRTRRRYGCCHVSNSTELKSTPNGLFRQKQQDNKKDSVATSCSVVKLDRAFHQFEVDR
jgi:hypothetical protein